MPAAPTKVRFHSRPAQLAVGGVTRVTNLTPQEQKLLEQFLTEQLGGQRYTS